MIVLVEPVLSHHSPSATLRAERSTSSSTTRLARVPLPPASDPTSKLDRHGKLSACASPPPVDAVMNPPRASQSTPCQQLHGHPLSDLGDSSPPPPRHLPNRRFASGPSFSPSWIPTTSPFLALTLALAILLPLATAASVPFENCLPTQYQESTPLPLQWVPLYVDAVFSTGNRSHRLSITTWGNVTGSWQGAQLPAFNDPVWEDPNRTDGKIVREPEPDNPNPRATTLISKVGVLSYTPYSDMSDFCDSSLQNATCPLGPVFNFNKTLLPVGLPSITLTNDFFSNYAFTTFSVTFIIIYGDQDETNIGCISTPVTPDLGGIGWMLKFLPLVILLSVGFATIFAAVWSPWGTTDVFKWTSNHGRDADLLRLVTPGFGDCLQYIQWVVLTGSLTLKYPGFFQPVVSQAAWSALMFNSNFVSKKPAWQSVVDGIYVTNSTDGLGRLSQLVGIPEQRDVWPGMMVWLMVIVAGVCVLVQAGFLVRWLYRYINKIPEEDLRSKDAPFTLGCIVRIIFNYFLLPIIALSTFQLYVAPQSPAYTIALAVVTLLLVLSFAVWLGRLIVKARPRSELFDDLPTLLLYGPLYNTYSDEAAGFALVPVVLSILRGVAIGCAQSSGVAQITILASSEVILLLTLIYFRPFVGQTAMNAYHSLFSALRLVTILLMVAFAPSLGVTEGPKGWIGYSILLIHGMVLVFGFFLNAIQTMVEVLARMLGAGGDDVTGLTRGGLAKIFGMRQLQRRMSRRQHGPSRQSQHSNAAMLDVERGSKVGFVMPSGRVRSESAGSINGYMGSSKQQHRSSSALDSLDIMAAQPRNFDSAASSFTPTTTGEASTFSFLPSPANPNRSPVTLEAADPYYRPPRRRRETTNEASVASVNANRSSTTDSRRFSQIAGSGGPLGDPTEIDGQISRTATPAAPGYPHVAPRQDYSTREVDFYYGVRGPALNSERAGRKLGTGPADPTGPMATAAGWLRSMFVGKTLEKGKGFEVVRSARMPPGVQAREEFDREPPPEGVPVAMSMLRNGPIESDDDDDDNRANRQNKTPVRRRTDDDGLGGEVSPVSPGSPDTRSSKILPPEPLILNLDTTPDPFFEDLEAPQIPRKSSRRHSGASYRAPSFNLVPPMEDHAPTQAPASGADTTDHHHLNSLSSVGTSRLPFERRGSQKRLSSNSSMEPTDDFELIDVNAGSEVGPNFGHVPQHSISHVNPEHQRDMNLQGSAAELVDVGHAGPSGQPILGSEDTRH